MQNRSLQSLAPQLDAPYDIALVYARGLYEPHRFSLIAILIPAHEKHHDRTLMLALGRIGRRFQYDN